MNDIQVARFNSILHKLLGIREGAPAPVLAPEIIPTVALEVDRPEWSFLGGEHLAVGDYSVAASAAEYSYASILNPTGSNALCVVESFRIQALTPDPNGTFLYWGGAVALADLQSQSVWRDTRGMSTAGGNEGLVCQIRTTQDANANLGTTLIGGYFNDQQMFEALARPFVLAPGGCLMARPSAVNLGITIVVNWRERALEPTEVR